MITEITEHIEEFLIHIANPELISPDFFIVWQSLRVMFIVVTLFFVGILLYLLMKSDYLTYRFKEDFVERKKTKPFLNVKIKKDWGEIMSHANHENESERKLAVIEADDALNDALSQLGYEGEDLLEKLKGLTEEIVPNIKDLQEAHKERRDIVYDPNKGLSKEEAKELIAVYEETFRYFQIF